MTLVMALLVNNAKVAALTLVASSLWVVAIFLWGQPYYMTFTNAMIVTMYGLLCWAAILATAQVYNKQDQSHLLTNVGLYGCAFVAIGLIASSWGQQRITMRRARAFVVRKRKRSAAAAAPIHHPTSPQHLLSPAPPPPLSPSSAAQIPLHDGQQPRHHPASPHRRHGAPAAALPVARGLRQAVPNRPGGDRPARPRQGVPLQRRSDSHGAREAPHLSPSLSVI